MLLFYNLAKKNAILSFTDYPTRYFFASEGHRKPRTYRANLCDLSIINFTFHLNNIPLLFYNYYTNILLAKLHPPGNKNLRKEN